MTASTSLRPEASAVLEYLRDHPGATARQIADFAGVDRRHVDARIETLRSHGLIGRQQSLLSGNNRYRYYAEVKK